MSIDFDENDFESPAASMSGDGLEHLLSACRDLQDHAGEGAQDAHSAVVETLNELEALGLSVCVVDKEDIHFAHIDDEDDLEDFVSSAIERRKAEGLETNASYVAISSEGHVLIVDEEDLSQCAVVRFNGAMN
jgi:hypothetical protein